MMAIIDVAVHRDYYLWSVQKYWTMMVVPPRLAMACCCVTIDRGFGRFLGLWKLGAIPSFFSRVKLENGCQNDTYFPIMHI